MKGGYKGVRAETLEFIIPAGYEKYFEEVASAFRSDGLPDVNHILLTASKHGLQMHMDGSGNW